MAKLTNKQHEQQQDRRVSKLEKRADADDKIVSKLEKRITALEKQMSNLKAKSK
ncbi:MAG: hypothetical protein KGZ37_10520 [Nitrosarchaeum sp.]|nr:hypothetical protein [Nitrosarchaeum sp.]